MIKIFKIKNKSLELKNRGVIFFFLILLFFGSLLLIFNFGLAQLTPEEEKAALEKELKELEAKIAQYEVDITKTQQEKNTLKNKIYILKTKIEKLNLQIRQNNIMIKDLTYQIGDTEKSINKTSLKIEQEREKLANILRAIYEEDQKSLIEILISEPNLSDFYNNLVALENLTLQSKELLETIKNLKSDLENQKAALDEEKEDLGRILKIQLLQKEEGESAKKEQENLLKITQGKESEYQKLLTQTKKRAAEIKARIFELIGVVKAPTFGEALEIAKYVEGLTGVRPAFLLAILEQESDLGKNVGQCYLSDVNTGAGVKSINGATIKKVMSPTRDVPYFLNITKELGRDPFKTLVSCPMSFGWGGAMGPAQFIPSTWVKYGPRVTEITGKSADPWNIRDAFLAAALYLADYGATQKTKDSEWKAAMIYFSGSTNSRYSFYGNSVLNRAERIQGWIDDIEKAQ